MRQQRALCPPLVLEIKDNGRIVQPWILGFEKATFAGDAFAFSDLKKECQRNKNIWNPQSLSRVKNSFGEALPRQLDMFDAGLLPMREEFFQPKLKRLLEKSFADTKACYQDVYGGPPRNDYLFVYLFRFLTAKIFQDRADVEGWAGLTDPREILEKATAHSGSSAKALPDEFFNAQILETAWHSIATNLNLQGLSVSNLAVIYEDSFLADETRRELGIHSTPSGLANYIVEKLPWEQLSVENRRVFEPFCGHGIFLARALERLQRDLDPNLTPSQRHQYFRQMLVGVEKDALALEVCRLILTLSDYPNDNSWQLSLTDVFTWTSWDETLASAGAVLANPPYEAFSEEERSVINARKPQPPSELLFRLLRQPPPLLGIVLPRSFLRSASYREANRQIAEQYEEVSIVELPPIFSHADNQTLALMASGRREKGNSVSIHFAEVHPAEVKEFLEGSKVSNERAATVELIDEAKEFSLWVPPQKLIAEWFDSSFPKLGSLATIHKGMNWIPRNDGQPQKAQRTDVASDESQEGFIEGAEKMKGNLSQFGLTKLRYLSLNEDDQSPRDKAWRFHWEHRKVVCNAARFQRYSPWRIAAWADENGLAFTKQFIAIWPDDGISTFALTAILCSPVANAFIREIDRDRDNCVSTLKRLPLPPKKKLSEDGLLHRQSEATQRLFSNGEASSARLREAVMRMDAAVLDAYEFSAQTQRYLLDQFSGWKRPINVPFDGYFSEELIGSVTLSDYVVVKYDWEMLDDRRCELIRKDIYSQNLSGEETEELEELENLADLKIRLHDPNPTAIIDALISKLKEEGKWIE